MASPRHPSNPAPPPRRVARLLLAAAAMLTAGAACSSDDDEAGVAGEPPTLTEDGFRQELVNADPPSPLMTAVGLDRLGSSGMLNAQRLFEEATAACMQRKGWEYQPRLLRGDVGVAWLPAMTRDEFARTHGFGARLDPVATSNGLLSTDEEELEYVNTLTLAESDAYYEDLNGALSGPDIEPAGCRGEALDTAVGGHFGAVLALLDESQGKINANPEYQAANEAYATCTSEQGLAWLDDPSIAMFIGYDESIRHELTETQEIDAALIDLECRYPWEIIARRIRHETQTPLVEANRDTLAEVRDILGG